MMIAIALVAFVIFALFVGMQLWESTAREVKLTDECEDLRTRCRDLAEQLDEHRARLSRAHEAAYLTQQDMVALQIAHDKALHCELAERRVLISENIKLRHATEATVMARGLAKQDTSYANLETRILGPVLRLVPRAVSDMIESGTREIAGRVAAIAQRVADGGRDSKM